MYAFMDFKAKYCTVDNDLYTILKDGFIIGIICQGMVVMALDDGLRKTR